MKKVCFAPTEWARSEFMLSDYKLQTPNNDGVWEDLIGVSDYKDADYIIIQDNTTIKNELDSYPKEKLIYFSREALDGYSIQKYPEDKFTHFSYWNNTGYLFTRWIYQKQGYGGTKKTYSQLKNEVLPKKEKSLCCILSDKEMCDGHVMRKKFTKDFLQKYNFDLYGEVNFRNSELVDNDKNNTLVQYKYCLGFDNQDKIDNFFGTQFTDAILAECCPIFWCGTDLSNHFPEGSFIQLDIRKENEIERIIEIIENDDFEKRIPAIKEAKRLLLDKYNVWPTIKSIVK